MPLTNVTRMGKPRGKYVNVRKRKTGNVSKPVRRTMATIAKRVLNKETKYCGRNIIDSSFNSSINTAAECYACMPQITQGDGDHQRIGSKITGKYLYVKGYATYDNVTVAGTGSQWPNHPIVARIMVLSQKNIRSNQLLPNVRVGNLLDDRIGTDATRGFAGANAFDITAPINKDLFTVHYDRKIKLYPQSLSGAGQGDALYTQGQRAVYFRARVKAPKTLMFDDSAMNAGDATNFAPFICAAWAYADGSAPPEPTVTPLHLQVQSFLYFTDA